MFSKALALTLAAGAAVQAHQHNGTWTTVTEVVDVYTTYCPEPTHLTMNHKIYTVTEACTYTITDCPCTVTKTIPSYPTTAPTYGPGPVNNNPGNNNAYNNANNAGNNAYNTNTANPSSNKSAYPTTAPPSAGNECPSGQNCPPVVAGAGQNAAAYGMALAGAIAAAAVAL
ncbi:hypothetical protein BBO_05163 [Beauveria brongniartii RCEF 3172]|uniref:Mmc protein n=1 Tax=Beauveria brongniartii RCEF 3172 TaxID=1081107 RepID=A0A167DK90_9HYPO|nr:hypothetical protein BBO_05163 [Beauveria brongniartii RCEF 3172]